MFWSRVQDEGFRGMSLSAVKCLFMSRIEAFENVVSAGLASFGSCVLSSDEVSDTYLYLSLHI